MSPGPTPVPPTLPVIRVVLLHTEMVTERFFEVSVCILCIWFKQYTAAAVSAFVINTILVHKEGLNWWHPFLSQIFFQCVIYLGLAI